MKNIFKKYHQGSLKFRLYHLFFGLGLLITMPFIIFSCRKEKENEKEKIVEDKTVITKIPELITDIEKAMIKQGLVDVQSLDSGIMVDLKYSTVDNFFGKDVYGDFNKAYLQKKPAIALRLAQYLLKKQNPDFSLLIFDATRPLSVQKVLWNSLDSIPAAKRKDFVADPYEGSIHNYGCAIDLTIYDKKTQKELDMGTHYDFFGFKAYPRLETQMLINGQLDSHQVNNRKLLRGIMETAGFEPITSEWWHFNFYSRERAKRTYKIVE